MENRCEHELSKARPAAGKTHGKAKAAAEEVLDDVHGRQVHQAKPKTCEQTDGEVENYDAGRERDVDVGGGEEEANCGKQNPGKGDFSVAARG